MTFPDFPLSTKIVVVTGGGSGINLSFSRLAVQAGAKVLIADLKLTADGEAFMKTQEAKQSAAFVKCDVTKRADLENLITVSEKEFGDVPDVYIAGAGVFEPVRIFEFRRIGD
jgi:NAD(P)-dependent dehydrogenase (short-subunit alcohol dehydrogenase family)